MFDLITDLWLANQYGRDVSPHRPIPPMHLCGRTWKFVCVCRGGRAAADDRGRWTEEGTDAVWRDGAWRSPIRQCATCRRWVEGAQIEPT